MAAKIIADPRMLPHFLTHEEACALLRCSPRLLQGFVKRDQLKQGVHYVRRGGTRTKLYIRDALVAWLGEEEKKAAAPPPKRGAICRADLTHSPELAAARERELGL